MTRQYMVGELSLLIAELGAAAPADHQVVRQITRLRREAETSPPDALCPVAASALAAGDALCWLSLSRGDMARFQWQAGVVSQLYEFAVCAGLMDEE